MELLAQLKPRLSLKYSPKNANTRKHLWLFIPFFSFYVGATIQSPDQSAAIFMRASAHWGSLLIETPGNKVT